HREIERFEAARTVEQVRAAWDLALEAGEIPGAYWATMTHPATTEALVRHVFGEIHMLSHLVGAANRADIRRLRDLEAAKAEVQAKVERQQAALRDAAVAHERAIGELRQLLACAVAVGAPASHDDEGGRVDALNAVLSDTKHRLARSESRATQLEARVRELAQRARDAAPP